MCFLSGHVSAADSTRLRLTSTIFLALNLMPARRTSAESARHRQTEAESGEIR